MACGPPMAGGPPAHGHGACMGRAWDMFSRQRRCVKVRKGGAQVDGQRGAGRPSVRRAVAGVDAGGRGRWAAMADHGQHKEVSALFGRRGSAGTRTKIQGWSEFAHSISHFVNTTPMGYALYLCVCISCVCKRQALQPQTDPSTTLDCMIFPAR